MRSRRSMTMTNLPMMLMMAWSVISMPSAADAAAAAAAGKTRDVKQVQRGAVRSPERQEKQQQQQRKVQYDGSESYQYIEDLSGYNLVYGKCIRMKVPDQNNNDDGKEGNSYFYNGRYYAQTKQFASFFLCDQGGKDDTCGTCDYDVEYVTDLGTFMQQSVEYMEGYCEACSRKCDRRDRLRFLEEEQQADGGGNHEDINCKSCTSACKNVDYDGKEYDETKFLECQYSHQDESGITYYSGPQCVNGDVVIGLFYDSYCSIVSAAQHDYGFNYATFNATLKACIDCSSTDVCQNFYPNNALHCSQGNDLYGVYNTNGMAVCKKYLELAQERKYKHSRSFLAVEVIATLIFTVALTGGFLVGSYTYYLRHRKHGIDGGGTKTKSKEQDDVSTPYSTMKDGNEQDKDPVLPPMD